jgi:hypothetical protein
MEREEAERRAADREAEQARHDAWVKARLEELEREQKNKEAFFYIGLVLVGATLPFILDSISRGVAKVKKMSKESATDLAERVKTMLEERRGYAGLDVNELLPDPHRPASARRSASPARRRPPRTELSSSMVDAVIDEFVKTRVGRA